VAAQDDFEEEFVTAGGQGFEAHVVDDEEVGFEVAGGEGAFCGGLLRWRRGRARRRSGVRWCGGGEWLYA